MQELTRRTFVAASSAAPAAFAQRAPGTSAPAWKKMLSGPWPESRLAQALVPVADWRPLPVYSDRAGWSRIPEDAKAAAVAAGETALKGQWSTLPATVFLDFKRDGNRSRYEAIRNQRRNRLRQLVVAECVEAKGRFLDEIVNGIWLTCEETYWGVPAHIGVQKAGSGLPDVNEPTVDLFAADTGSLLAWASYLLGSQFDKVSPLVMPRIAAEVNRRILTPNLEREDFGWMGLSPSLRQAVNNWNPWINSNWLTCVLLLENEPKRRVASVHKILRSLDRFVDGYPPDGGCDEGPSYWGHAGGSLYECLDLLYSASAKKIDFYSMPLIGEIGKYIYRTHINGEWYVNFADASARMTAPGDLIYRFGRSVGSDDMKRLGAYAASLEPVGRSNASSIARQLDGMFDLEDLRKADKTPPLVRDVFLPETGVFVARAQGGSAEGLYVAAQGGHNAESHNHNDVGNFIVYVDGKPALIDVGVETYTARTFSANRYDIWTMQSAYHNLPTVNGVMQMPGRSAEARDLRHKADDRTAEFSLEIAAAWPPEAQLDSWRRTILLDRKANRVNLEDRYRLKGPGKSIVFHFMSAVPLVQVKPGVASFAGLLQLEYDAARLKAEVDEIRTEDSRLVPIWGNRLYRLNLTLDAPPASDEMRFAFRKG